MRTVLSLLMPIIVSHQQILQVEPPADGSDEFPKHNRDSDVSVEML